MPFARASSYEIPSPVLGEEGLDDVRLGEVAGPQNDGGVGVSHFFVQRPKSGGLVVCPQLQEIILRAALTSGSHPVYNFS